jgi:hypothetical protein
MKHKMILLALAAVSAVMFAVPAVASAGEWEIDSGKLPLSFTASGGEATLTQEGVATKVICTANTGSGKYASKTTGEQLTLTFPGCKENVVNTSCTTADQTAGTIKTTDLTFHNIMIASTAQKAGGTPGILVTPNAGHFASFTCDFGFMSVEVTGNGIIGDISAPKCSESTKTATLTFESSATGVQKYTQVTTEGIKFDLDAKENGTSRTASEDASGTLSFPETVSMTCA